MSAEEGIAHWIIDSRKRWCVPPVKWMQKVFMPADAMDWRRVAFQPMLYLFLWIGAVCYLIFDDIFAIDRDPSTGLTPVWLFLSLVCPPLALVSVRMVSRGGGVWKYRGFWVCLAADIGQFTALLTYTIQKFTSGDFHVYPVTILVATTVFVFHLVMRDMRRLHDVEKLATELHQEEPDG